MSVSREANGNVELTSNDIFVKRIDADKTWTLSWKWLDDVGPQHPVGSGLGEYPEPSCRQIKRKHSPRKLRSG